LVCRGDDPVATARGSALSVAAARCVEYKQFCVVNDKLKIA
jgi:hypothetical protein